jgi:hypothetical protein
MKDEEKQGKPVNPKHLEVIKTNLPVVTEFCGMKPYQGDYSYDSLKDYMQELETVLGQQGNKATLKADAMMSSMIREKGKEAVLQLKKDNYNLQLEDVVMGSSMKRMLDIVDDAIVYRIGSIYLEPRNKMGRAPFYSSEKILGSWHIKTLWFNIAVLLLMSIIAAGLLFADCPGRFIRKSEQ